MAKVPDGAQEKLLAVAERTGQMAMPNFEVDPSQDPSVDIVTRNIHLINALGAMSAIDSRLGFVKAVASKAHRPRISERYADQALDAMSEGARRNVKKLGSVVKFELMRALGIPEDLDRDEARAMWREDFADFRKKYDGTINAERRYEYSGLLGDNIEQIQHAFTEKRRATALEKPNKKAKRETGVGNTEVETGDDMQLNTPERMRAIFEDIRAGFLPTTHMEKNQVLAFLDYMDNPQYEVGVINQLFEIFNHQERVYKKQNGKSARGAAGLESLVSIIYQMGDFFMDAAIQKDALHELQIAVAACDNPNVTLLEEIGPEHPGYAAFVRYLDLREIKDGSDGKIAGFRKNVLSTTRNEVSPRAAGKNKITEDKYTGQLRPQEFTDRIAERVASLKIGEVRADLNRALTNEQKRFFFHGTQLMAVTELLDDDYEGPGTMVSDQLGLLAAEMVQAVNDTMDKRERELELV